MHKYSFLHFILICISMLFPAICSATIAPVSSYIFEEGDSIETFFWYNQRSEQEGTLYPADSVLTVENDDFRITMLPGTSGYRPNYSHKDVARIKEGGIIIVESLDGKEISDIQFDMLHRSDIDDCKEFFTALVDGEMCRLWKGWSKRVEFVLVNDTSVEAPCPVIPNKADGRYVYYIPRIHIKRYNGLKMIVSIDNLTTSRNNPAVAQFTLKVWNDNGVKDFTVTAEDATSGVSYGSCTVAREQPEAAQSRAGETQNEGAYTISGQMELPGISASTRTKLRIKVAANYDDERESVTEPVPTEVDVKPSISTDVTETGREDAPCEYYNLQGLRVPHPSAGVYIRRQGSAVTKVRLP